MPKSVCGLWNATPHLYVAHTGVAEEADAADLRRAVVVTGVAVAVATGVAFGAPMVAGATVGAGVTGAGRERIVGATAATHGHGHAAEVGVAVGRVPEIVAALHHAAVLPLAAGRDERVFCCWHSEAGAGKSCNRVSGVSMCPLRPVGFCVS